MIATEQATPEDWISHAVGSSGCFTGGLNAVRTLSLGLEDRKRKDIKDWAHFVSRFAMFLKLKSELEDLRRAEREDSARGLVMKNSFIFISLPAVIYQRSNAGLCRELRKAQIHVPNDKEMAEAVSLHLKLQALGLNQARF